MSKSKKQLLLELLELENDNLGNLGISGNEPEEKIQDDISSQKDEETDKITAPKKLEENRESPTEPRKRGPKKGQITQLTEKQKEALKKGQQIRDENNKKRLEEKKRKEEEEKKLLEEKLIKKAISLKKKQIKKQKILEELSDDDDEQVIKEKIISNRRTDTQIAKDTKIKEPKPEQKYIFNFI